MVRWTTGTTPRAARSTTRRGCACSSPPRLTRTAVSCPPASSPSSPSTSRRTACPQPSCATRPGALSASSTTRLIQRWVEGPSRNYPRRISYLCTYDLYSPMLNVLDVCMGGGGSMCIKELHRLAQAAPPPLQNLLEIKRKL
jgi:hypothetical protein